MENFKKSDDNQIEKKPLEYWEEESYMKVVSYNEIIDESIFDGVFERIAEIEDVEVLVKQAPTKESPGFVTLTYDDEEYQAGFYFDDFVVPDIGINENSFSDEELNILKIAENAVTVFMPFRKDSQKSYHLQLKLALAIVPDLAVVYDESAERVLSGRRVRLDARSEILPAATSLYTVQGIKNDDGDDLWLHTHGLCRCGIPELEILQSDEEHFDIHYQIIAHLASLMADGSVDAKNDRSFHVGNCTDGTPITVATVDWTEALGKYENLILGGIQDRQETHNTESVVLFLFQNEEDEEKHILTKLKEFDDKWGDNPIFFFSTKETNRMALLARERFHFVKDAYDNGVNSILIKIGLDVDEQHKDEDNPNQKEHIWFELVKFNDDGFTAKLTQDPYWVSDIHKDDERDYTVNSVTDWRIAFGGRVLSPETVYTVIET